MFLFWESAKLIPEHYKKMAECCQMVLLDLHYVSDDSSKRFNGYNLCFGDILYDVFKLDLQSTCVFGI